jgi:hypothetical protein
MTSPHTETYEVDGPTRVRVLYYEDGSIRFRIYGCPYVIEEAFLTGNRQQNAIIKVSPRRDQPSPSSASAS